MRRNRVIVSAAVAIVLSSSVTACSSGTSSTTAGANGGSTVKVAFIQGVIGDNFYISMECGVRAAATKLGGVDVTVQGPQKWDPSLQQPILTSVAATKPAAILIAPNDVSALQRPLEEAAKTSKIVLVDTTIEKPSIAVSEISSDNVGGGAAAFNAIKKLVPGGGKVLVIDNQPGISTSDARVKGFKDAVAKDSTFNYIGVQYAKNEPSKAAQIVTSTLQKYPDLKAIFATNIYSAEGAATGIRQAGATGKVKVVGFDAGPAQVKALQEDTVQAIIAQQPYDIGYQGVQQAVAAVKGQPTKAKIQTGFTILTKDNLNTPKGQAALYASKC